MFLLCAGSGTPSTSSSVSHCSRPEGERTMLYDSTVILLRCIVQRLETNGEPGWDDCLQSGNQCLFELHQMSASATRTQEGKPNSRFRVVNPAFERATRAIPDVKAMMRAVRRRDK